MTSHKDHQRDLLGINSQYEADELEHELDIRFDRFSYQDREAWVQQNAYLDAYANTRTESESADTAGVTVSTAQAWKFLNTLGFKRRLEIADLRFSDSLQVLALERAREPDAPASLLIALLRAHIPEKFSSNGHTCDTSKADELLFHYSQDAKRELDAGHPTFRAIANGTYQPRHERRNTQPHNYDTATEDLDTPNRHTGEEPAPYSIRGRYPETARSNLSPAGGEIQRGGSFPENQYDSQETTLHDDTPPSDEDDLAHSNLSPSGEDTLHSNLSPAGGEIQRGGSFTETQFDSQETTPHDDIHPVDPDEVARANLSPTTEEHTSSPSAPSAVNPTRHSRERGNPETAHSNLSPAGGEIQRGGSFPKTQFDSEETTPHDDIHPVDPDEVARANLSPSPEEHTSSPSPPSAVKPTRRPIASIFQTRRPSQNDDPNTFKVKRF